MTTSEYREAVPQVTQAEPPRHCCGIRWEAAASAHAICASKLPRCCVCGGIAATMGLPAS
eukprot:2601893-Alexandrium_andersonii.AAC.1